MPELPEVETICQGLRINVMDKTIAKVSITNFNLRKPVPVNIAENISKARIIKVLRRAKYIQIFMDNNLILLIHLGMSGKILIKDQNYCFQKHDHVTIELNDGMQLIYNDPRRFGLIMLLNQTEHHEFSSNMGVEPLEEDFTIDSLTNILRNNKHTIKNVLMDNRKIVGIGNIYAAESLFLSNIAPTRTAASLREEEIKLLYNSIIFVLKDAIAKGGSSLKDYSTISGEKGYFQHYFKVYSRDKQQCTNCDAIILKIKQAGRSSYYCPHCQF